MAGLDGAGQHPLSLKVMRISRPSLASHWTPFFSSSPSFSAHSTASALSLQGTNPLTGHPKTLRDLTQASPLLTLPSAFGAIQLGETFSCVLSVNNEVETPVDAVSAKVEMQTSSSKVALADVTAGGTEGSQSGTLNIGDSLELSVACEIKELGQHVLACTVTYRTPPGMRPATSGSSNANDPFLQTFRKFYKFTVTNPLSVKSKVHVPHSPSALLSRDEREKVFLEVHVQNLTQGPLWFESIRLDPVDGWNVTDTNISDDESGKSLFSGSMALMSPQDLRVYVYILTPKKISSATSVLVPPSPGTVIPLGRLDISWRSSMGEPGRLLTSVLSRRIPLPPPSVVIPPSALPPYLQKGTLPNVPRARSPSLQQTPQSISSGTAPPQRPASPLKRSTTPGPPMHSMSLPMAPNASVPSLPLLPGQPPSRPDVEVDLVLIERPDKATVYMEKSFSLRFSLAISAILPSNAPDLLGQEKPPKSRQLTFAVQHTIPIPQPEVQGTPVVNSSTPIQAPRRLKKTMSFDTVSSTPGVHSPASRTGSIDVLTPRRVMSPPPSSAGAQGPVPTSGGESYVTSPSSAGTRPAGAVTVGGLTERLRRVALSEALGIQENRGWEAFGDDDEAESSAAVRLPAPYSNLAPGSNDSKAGRVQFSGPSAIILPPVTLAHSSSLESSSSEGNGHSARGEACVEFSLSFLPREQGFARIGGLRVLLVEDREQQISEETQDGSESVTLHAHSEIHNPEAQIIREWDIIAEVWVR